MLFVWEEIVIPILMSFCFNNKKPVKLGSAIIGDKKDNLAIAIPCAVVILWVLLALTRLLRDAMAAHKG